MIRVSTPSRLHFGLLSLGDGEALPDRHGRPLSPARQFGGVGLMAERPGVRVAVAPAAEWSAEGPSAGRALAFARTFAESLRRDRPDVGLPPRRVVVEAAPPEHVGLGVGTQLGLAVARALAEAWGCNPDIRDLASRTGRGARSALGVHGFARGGFLVESGKRAGDALAPLAVRATFPPDWRIVLAVPRVAPGLHGPGEREAFARLAARPWPAARTDALCRLVLLGLLPALAEADLDAFGEALYDFNARVGEAFAPVQGGVYAGPRVAECVAFLRGEGVRGVGQSSWGPAVFGVVGDDGRAAHVVGRLAARFGFGPEEAWATPAAAGGARLLSP